MYFKSIETEIWVKYLRSASLFSAFLLENMLPLFVARPGAFAACPDRDRPRIGALRQAWRRAGADYDTGRRLTAAQLGRYGWLKHRRFALAANDRGTRLQETDGRGVS